MAVDSTRPRQDRVVGRHRSGLAVGHADDFIASLRARGCRFALNDFGSGLASFANLKNPDVDCLKIDGSFVCNILTDPVDRALARSITEIGKGTGKTVAQGYHLGRLVPFEQFFA